MVRMKSKNLVANNKRGRRSFLIQGLYWITGVSVWGIQGGCSKRQDDERIDFCQDLSHLSEAEMAVRKQLAYVEQSSFADRNCKNCQLFVKSQEGLSCGSCLAMKGPVAENGYCSVWAPIN